ncbi:Cytochrome P450 family protein [Melia azedarach]|uniref:Cytochrome P450 family protein n=1 Tax=Melia azedarach TaxID=155640 RepID=A0ACC1XWI7_MELAZ|nr:Cytochrome P450 family protein [Melia azedarach]
MQRKVALALINSQSFRKFLVKISYDMVDNVLIPIIDYASKQGIILDFLDLFQRFTFDSTCKIVNRWLGFGIELKMKKAQVTADNELFECIRRKKEESTEGIMMKESEGRDTISSALTWLFLLLSRNPQEVSKIREKLESIIPAESVRKSCLFDIHDLNKLVYFHGALCEALRLYPSVAFQHKSSVVADVLPSGRHVSLTTKILFFMYAMGRMKSIWGEDCLEFKPVRWISENGRIKHEPSYKFLPFNAGPRTCLGKEVFVQTNEICGC